MTLRLHCATHEPEAHPWLVTSAVRALGGRRLRHKPRDQRVKGTFARRYGVRQSRIQREAGPAIVEREAGTWHYDSRAEFVEEAVDEGDHVAVAVGNGEIDGLAGRERRPGIYLQQRS